MQKRAIRPGFHDKMVSGNSYKDWLDLTKYVHDVLNLSGYPISGDCCIAPPSSTDVGKVLTIGSDGKIALAIVSGVSGTITAVNLGTTTATYQQIQVVGGTNFNLPLATTALAGLLSPTDKVKLNTLTGTNTGDVTVTDSGSIDFTLTGQNITATVSGASTATIGQIPSSNGIGGFTWGTLISKEKLDYIDPTALNTVPNLTAVPADPTKVKFYVNGVLDRGITSDALGVVTVNSGTLGYNIDITDEVTANYFV